MATMNISLPDKMKAYIESRVSNDGYGNVSEFFRDLIRRDERKKEQESRGLAQLEQLKVDIEVGMQALRTGNFTEYTSSDELFGDIEKEGKRRLKR